MTTSAATVDVAEPALGLELMRPSCGTARLVVTGDLDIATTQTLDDAVTFLCATHDDVELDLSAVTFADLAAFRSLALAGLARQGCNSVHVVASSDAVQRLVRAVLATMRRAPSHEATAHAAGSQPRE